MSMEILRAGAAELGLTLSSRHMAQFEAYYRELSAWNQRFNLTAITARDEVQRRHFLDSLSCLLALDGCDNDIPNTMPLQTRPGPRRLIDIGSGPGFPGLPLKIMLPDAKVTLVESTGKKVRFLEHMVQTLELDDVTLLAKRAEEVGQDPEHRERYDVAAARAVAHLATLVEYCLPLCRPGGRMIAPKGEDAHREADEAGRAIEALGGKLVGVKPVQIADIASSRYLVVIDKVAHTPDHYPRRVGVPSKRPLRD